MKEKIMYVHNACKFATEDNWNDGENPDTTQQIDVEAKGFYNSIDELAEALDLPTDKENWMAFDDGRIICSTTENEDGFEPSDSEMEAFKKGHINLYACEYNFFILFIEGKFIPSTKEIAERFNIEEYD